MNGGIDIYIKLEITMTRKSGTHLHVTYGALNSLIGLIISTHRDLHHWRSNQQPQYAEAETLPLGHRFMARLVGSLVHTMTC